MRVKNETCQYYMLNETAVDPDLAIKKREILRENVVNAAGKQLMTITFKQVLQSFGVRNWNGRTYSDSIVMRGIDSNPLIQTDIKNKTWGGEYGHPLISKGMNEIARQMTIFPPNVCWTIDKYWKESNLLMGECTTVVGGYGEMMRDRILTGLPAMASSRALGGVDKNGGVLPGYTLITFDGVFRPSHKEAYEVMGTENYNYFPIPTGQANTMTESAIPINPFNDPSFADYLISESASREQLSMLCDTFQMDYDSMVITESAVKLTKVDGLNKTTITIPMYQLIGAEYYNLF